jgi:hypothetical protein
MKQSKCGCDIDSRPLRGGVNSITYSLYPDHFSDEEQDIFKRSEQAYARAGFSVKRVLNGADVIVHLTTHNQMAKLYPSLANSPGLSLTDRSLRPMHIHLHLENWLHIPKHLGSDFTDLDAYREALISHEFAHVFGYDHVGCACKGCPRDVRQQPSRSSGGCNHNHSEIVISSKSPYSSVNF